MARSAEYAFKRQFPTRSASVREMVTTACKVLTHPVNLLLLGETGSGKDYLAEAIHACGPRSSRPFVRIDCATLPPELFESELFGHEKGAFTDARERKRGKLELANGGTVYFDEITALAPALQAKLLRTIQEKELTRLGGQQSYRLDIRIIASTRRSAAEITAGDVFRPDLYFRLNVVAIEVPPLRARQEDFPILSRAILRELGGTAGGRKLQLSQSVLHLLEEHDWPGNIRELRNVLERAAVVASAETISLEDLPAALLTRTDRLLDQAVSGRWRLEELEKQYIDRIVQSCGGNYSKAAAVLGINRKTLLEKRRKYGLQ